MTIDDETSEEEYAELEGEGEDEEALSAETQEERVYRLGGISYLHIPTKNAFEAGVFYETVFGWKLHGDPAWPLFEDATGHVIGRWVTDLDVAPESTGVRPYVHVESIDEVLDNAVANGGEVDRIPFQEGDIWVATFRDPSGTVIGWDRNVLLWAGRRDRSSPRGTRSTNSCMHMLRTSERLRNGPDLSPGQPGTRR